MQLELTEEQQLVKASIREFCETYVEPAAVSIDEGMSFPAETIKGLAEQDMMGIPYPEEYGGGGADYLTCIVGIEELSRACGSTGSIVGMHTSLACFPLCKFGTEAQKKKFLAPLARGEMLGSLALTDGGQGIDEASSATTAVTDGNDYVLNGTKVYVPLAPVAGVFIVTASIDSAREAESLSAFIVPVGTPGLEIAEPIVKMGLRGALSSKIELRNCRIPGENLLGLEGQGASIAVETLDCGRISNAAQAIGIAQAALEEAVRYSKERCQFGQAICNFQAIQWMLADMGTEIEAARCLTYYAAWCHDQGGSYRREAAIAKLMASQAAVRASDAAVQIFGGIGYVKGQKVERLYRDAKVVQISQGTPEIMKRTIANSVPRREIGMPSPVLR